MQLPDPFQITESFDGRSTVLSVQGELDMATAPELRTALARLANRKCDVVVDLSRVTFMDSSGIRVLLDAHQSMVRVDGRFALGAASRAVTRALKLTQLDQVIPTIS
ncbi:MAG TPA: STAS domain-containing protein [Acidimicrobiales bacterium]|nr:STAS domain-containing protein [Acidimicrobiales bacterium]